MRHELFSTCNKEITILSVVFSPLYHCFNMFLHVINVLTLLCKHLTPQSWVRSCTMQSLPKSSTTRSLISQKDRTSRGATIPSLHQCTGFHKFTVSGKYPAFLLLYKSGQFIQCAYSLLKMSLISSVCSFFSFSSRNVGEGSPQFIFTKSHITATASNKSLIVKEKNQLSFTS